jgi:hypothetical protein
MFKEPQMKFVPVLVPSDLYPEITRQIAAHLERETCDSTPESNKPESPAPESPAPTKGWAGEDVPRLRILLANNKTALALLDKTSENPGVRFNFRQVAERAGRTPAEARADLRSLTTVLRKHFQTDQWPVIITWPTATGETFYEALPVVAQEWPLTAGLIRKDMASRQERGIHSHLTDAEKEEIRRRIAVGEPNKVIADAMGITPKSVEAWRKSLELASLETEQPKVE